MQRWAGPATGVGTKTSPSDLVSDADRDAQAVVERIIRSARPDDAIVGEEDLASQGTSGLSWLVDPLDGTVNFLYGIPHWCVSVACSDADGPLAGVVFDPTRQELFHARRGGGAWLGERPLAVSACADIGSALVATGFSYDPRLRAQQAELATRLPVLFRDIRRAGSAALDLAYTAAGRVDGYFEVGVNPWDVEAGRLLVVEAGGVATRVDGIGVDERWGIVASGSAIHDRLVGLLRGSDGPSGPAAAVSAT
jgi:myo-inositol-1(or 4)-monophosphatase